MTSCLATVIFTASTLQSARFVLIDAGMKLLHASYCLATAASTVVAGTVAYTSSIPQNLTWNLLPTNSNEQFRGLSSVTDDVVWVAGTTGTVLRSTNSGVTWSNVSPTFAPPEDPSDVSFRDIQAWSVHHAVVLSIGMGNASRIYRTQNGGKSWDLTFINEDEQAFYDCMAFEKNSPDHGIALSDPVDGRFRLLETWDGGKSWKILDTNGTMPPALEGEFAFAASGTCIEAAAGRWYFATGGVSPGRIFRSKDPYKSWQVSNSSIAGGAAAGVFSVRFRDAKNGIAVGGDYEKPTANSKSAAWSHDGGSSWREAESFPGGYRSGVSWVPGRRDVAIAVGTSGSDITIDAGRNWKSIGSGTFDAVECSSRVTCWASGSGGRVARLKL
ncbi:hypothetical protein ACN47E_008448 [Coniothyrium glycines]